MHPIVSSIIEWIRQRTENVVSVMLGIMFVAFIVQIVFATSSIFRRWSSELSVIMWLYMCSWGRPSG